MLQCFDPFHQLHPWFCCRQKLNWVDQSRLCRLCLWCNDVPFSSVLFHKVLKQLSPLYCLSSEQVSHESWFTGHDSWVITKQIFCSFDSILTLNFEFFSLLMLIIGVLIKKFPKISQMLWILLLSRIYQFDILIRVQKYHNSDFTHKYPPTLVFQAQFKLTFRKWHFANNGIFKLIFLD